MIRSLRTELALLATLAAFAPASAHADDLQEARRCFGLGEELYARGSYEEAYTWYEAAYAAAPLADFLFNMGQCQRNLGNVAEALALYRRFLASNPPDDKRTIVEEIVRDLELSHPDLARPPPEADAGGGSDGQDTAGAGGTTGPREPPARAPLLARLRAPTWITAAGAVVLFGAAGLLTLRAQQGQDDLDSLDCARALEQCLDTAREADGYFLARNVTLAVGGAALVATAVLAIVDASANGGADRSNVTVVPMVGPGLAGLVARRGF